MSTLPEPTFPARVMYSRPCKNANRCPLCSSAEAELISERARDGAKLTSVACLGCGLLRSDPLPSAAELREFYERDYRLSYKGVRKPKPKHVARAGRLARLRLRDLSRYIKPGDRVLDIGSGGGEWLCALERYGARATGVELDRGYADFARREYGVDVIVGDIDETEFDAGAFDVVTLFHVLEHLPNPVSAVAKALSCLHGDGRLVVEVPNMASLHQHPHKRFHPAHVVGFTVETLALAAVKAGGSPVEVRVGAFDRNITMVIERSHGAVARGAAPSASSVIASLRPRAVARYYASPVTIYRFASRIVEFGREYAAVWGKESASGILDSVLREK